LKRNIFVYEYIVLANAECPCALHGARLRRRLGTIV